MLGTGCTPLLLEANPGTESGVTEEEDAEFFIEEDETILPSLDPFDFADVPLQDDILNNVLMSILLSFHFPQ